MCRKIEEKQAKFFREELREARNKAVEDAEGFQEILFAIEKLGSYLHSDGHSLSHYKPYIKKLAQNSDLLPVPQSFDNLFDIVKDARNDALHQGAFARHLTQNAVKLSLILEDALEKVLEERKLKVEDFMVSNVICADLWKPLAFIRQQMLANSFSYLPFYDDDKQEWYLISDYQLAKYLRSANSSTQRKKKLQELLKDVWNGLNLKEADRVSQDDDICKVLEIGQGKPVLVTKDEKAKRLFGIITPFDIL